MRINYKAEVRNTNHRKTNELNSIIMEQLYDKIKVVENINYERMNLIRKMCKPFLDKIPPETFQKILDGKFEVRAIVDKNLTDPLADPLVTRVGWIAEVSDWELGGMR